VKGDRDKALHILKDRILTGYGFLLLSDCLLQLQNCFFLFLGSEKLDTSCTTYLGLSSDRRLYKHLIADARKEVKQPDNTGNAMFRSDSISSSVAHFDIDNPRHRFFNEVSSQFMQYCIFSI
jgi:hypothetical protein